MDRPDLLALVNAVRGAAQASAEVAAVASFSFPERERQPAGSRESALQASLVAKSAGLAMEQGPDEASTVRAAQAVLADAERALHAARVVLASALEKDQDGIGVRAA